MNILLFGPPGAGKGTQSEYLVETYKLSQISTGELIRKEIAEGSELGIAVQEVVEAGGFPSDDLVNRIAENAIRRDVDKPGFVFDGYPRTLYQAEVLDNLLTSLDKSLDAVIELQVDDDLLLNRIIGRLVCKDCKSNYHIEFNPPAISGVCDKCGGHELEQRKDDSVEALKNRLALYRQETKQLINYYEQRGIFYRIDGSQPVEAVSKLLDEILSKFQANLHSGTC